MPGMGERSYVFAKACGIIGKSFVGKRIPRLLGMGRLSELDRLVFPASGRDLPERELLLDLENRIVGRSVEQILAIVGSFRKPPELLVRLLRSYEYSDLKSCLALIAGGPDDPRLRSRKPFFTDIGPFRTVRFEFFPELPAMLEGTEFEFLLKKDLASPGLFQAELDQLYYTKLWEALKALPKKDRLSSERILSEEISLRNTVWALRLRIYYGMESARIKDHLMLSLAADALAALDLPLDNRDAWKGWGRESFLNAAHPGESWRLDPRYFQNAASEYLYRLALHSFRRKPLSMDTSFCFIKLKQFEEDVLTSVAEGLGLGMSGRDVFSLLEVEP
ncbi:MAG: V-type ATPase subunit [Treponema sp.]|jgi:hypothetical protein|nr:V-type ATPase subunit [Treponema sp.]